MRRRLSLHSSVAQAGCRHLLTMAAVLLSVALLGQTLTPMTASAGARSPGRDTSSAVADPVATENNAIFSDDFEAYGDDSLWSREFPFPVQSEIVSNGNFAARIVNMGGNPVYGRASLDSSYMRVFVRIRFYVVNVGPHPVTLLNLRAANSSPVVSIRIDSSGRLSYLTGPTGITSSSAVMVASGTWHELQVLVDVSSETSDIRIWLDHAELTSLRNNVWLGDQGIKMLDLGDNSAGQQSDILFDDVIVDDEFIPVDRQADPVPGTLVVNTYPAWQNIPFELDGQIFYSGIDGRVEIPVARWSTDLRSRITVRNSLRPDGSLAVFTGWKQWFSVRSRDVYAAFRISEPVTFSFVDGSGQPVDPSIIDRLTIKSNSGDLLVFEGEQLTSPVLIPVEGTAFGPNGIESRTTTYVVDEVVIGGSNAVHRSQQKSPFETSRDWTIPLLFYSVTFQSRDAFFGSALGESIVVQSHDGSEQEIQLDANGEATIPRLSRGEYSVMVVGGGYSPPRPIYVSRDQAIEMKVISPIDVASLLTAVGLVVIALLLIGRPFLVTTPYRLLINGSRATCQAVKRKTRRWRWEGRS